MRSKTVPPVVCAVKQIQITQPGAMHNAQKAPRLPCTPSTGTRILSSHYARHPMRHFRCNIVKPTYVLRPQTSSLDACWFRKIIGCTRTDPHKGTCCFFSNCVETEGENKTDGVFEQVATTTCIGSSVAKCSALFP